MRNDTEELELKPLLRRLLYRGLGALALFLIISMMLSLVIRNHLQKRFAEQLSQTVRNDLLIGNNAAVLKTLQQNIGENFSEISYRDGSRLLFVLDDGGASPALLERSIRIPICLRLDQVNCTAALVYRYSPLAYIPYLLLMGLAALLIFLLVFWVFRQHVVSYCREQLKSHKEAALGRLSARICHDLKLPAMIFQRVAYVDSPAQFMELRPQLQSHLQRLYAMIEKLKKVELEGLVRPESHTIHARDLESFLASIAPTPQQLQLRMRPSLSVHLDLEKWERSLANLVLNAFQAGARLVQVSLREEGQDLLVQVENDGPAMPRDILQALRSDHPAAGQGLGLRIVKDTVAAHGGLLEVESTAQGTRFVLRFPNALMAPARRDEKPAARVPVTADPTERSHLIWLDADLLATARAHISSSALGAFELTADPAHLPQAQLLVSRDEQVIDLAIQEAIPTIMASRAADTGSWIHALQSRLRLLQRKEDMSTPTSDDVRNSGQMPSAVGLEAPSLP